MHGFEATASMAEKLGVSAYKRRMSLSKTKITNRPLKEKKMEQERVPVLKLPIRMSQSGLLEL